MSKPRIFISYTHADADRDWIRAFAEALKHSGAKVWLDELVIHAGEALSPAIEKGLRSSDILVSIITPESIKRPWLFFEIGTAVSMGKRVVAILPQEFDPSSLPQPLRSRKFLVKNSPEETAEELLAKTEEAAYREEERA